MLDVGHGTFEFIGAAGADGDQPGDAEDAVAGGQVGLLLKDVLVLGAVLGVLDLGADGVAVWAHAPNGGPLSAGLPSTYLPAAFLLTHSDGKDVYGVAGTAVDILCNVSGQPTIVTA